MKDRIKKFLAIIIFVTLLFNAYTAFSLRHTEKTIGESTVYSQRQINSALNTAARCFLPILTECKVTKLYYDEEWNINLCHEVRIFDENKELHLMKDGKMLVGRLVVDGMGENVSYVDSIAPMWGYATESEKGFTRLQDEPRKLELTVPANIVKEKRCGLVTRNYVVSDDESGLSGYGDYRYLGLQELEV